MTGIAAVATATVLLFCWRRYELAIGLILLSPWVNWLLYSNTAKTTEQAVETGTASYLRILLVVLVGCCGTAQLLRSWLAGQVKSFPKYLFVFGLFVVYAIMSTVYSLDQKFTLIRSFEFLIFFMFLLGLHVWLNSRPKLDRTLNIYYWVIVIGMILNAAALILMPHRVWDWKMPDRFQGLTDHPNTFGALCMMAYPILTWKHMRSRGGVKSVTAVVLCVTAGLHVLSGSRSSLVAAVVGAIVWLFLLARHITLKHVAVCLTFTLLLAFGVSFLILTKPASMKRRDSAVTSLTGRTDFWKGCALLIREKPVQGYGYGVAGKVWEDPRFYREGEKLWVGSVKSSLHNGYLSLAIGLGVVGLALWLTFISIPTWRVLALKSSPYKAFILAMIIQLLVLNFVESALATGSQIHTSLIFWIVLVIAGRLPEILMPETEHLLKANKGTNLGFVNSANIPTGLCAGYPGA